MTNETMLIDEAFEELMTIAYGRKPAYQAVLYVFTTQKPDQLGAIRAMALDKTAGDRTARRRLNAVLSALASLVREPSALAALSGGEVSAR